MGAVWLEGKLNRDIRNKNVIQSTGEVRLSQKLTSRQDSASEHPAKTTQEHLGDLKMF